MDFVLILAIGLVAGTLSGIVGFGSSIMLMPVLVILFGPLQAVPIMAIAALGAATLLALPVRVIEMALGVFFIAMIGVRR